MIVSIICTCELIYLCSEHVGPLVCTPNAKIITSQASIKLHVSFCVANPLTSFLVLTLASQNGFWILCAEALQYELTTDFQSLGYVYDQVEAQIGIGTPSYGGLWNIPEVQTEETGPKCDPDDSLDNQYMINVLDQLLDFPYLFDSERIYTYGCTGASMSFWQAVCLELRHATSISSFATHSTGLKVKGDGVLLESFLYQNVWGECTECEFFPVVPVAVPGLKACVFDNIDNPTEEDPYYYKCVNFQKAFYFFVIIVVICASFRDL